MKKIILGIETSCDETGLALVMASGGLASPKFKILKNLVASQIKIHAPFGGVVPNLAKREHLKNLPILFGKIFGISNDQFSISKMFHDSRFKIQDVDLIAVTIGPGLEPALWTGITFAKQLYNSKLVTNNNKIKLIGVNHLEGHLYSFLLPSRSATRNLKPSAGGGSSSGGKTLFPAVALIVSGGHTILLLVKDFKNWKKLGETRDDAVGEAFDKVARLLKLPYLGGPALEKLARKGNPKKIEFPRPMIYDNSPAGEFDFSFSGLKTSVLYYLRDHPPKFFGEKLRRASGANNKITTADVAASFQAAAVDVLVKKTLRAVREFSSGGGSAFGGDTIKSVLLSGGVAANRKLRSELRKAVKKLNRDMRHVKRSSEIKLLVADQKYNTDNAVMIAAAGYMTYLRKKKYPLRANGNLEI